MNTPTIETPLVISIEALHHLAMSFDDVNTILAGLVRDNTLKLLPSATLPIITSAEQLDNINDIVMGEELYFLDADEEISIYGLLCIKDALINELGLPIDALNNLSALAICQMALNTGVELEDEDDQVLELDYLPDGETGVLVLMDETYMYVNSSTPMSTQIAA